MTQLNHNSLRVAHLNHNFVELFFAKIRVLGILPEEQVAWCCRRLGSCLVRTADPAKLKKVL